VHVSELKLTSNTAQFVQKLLVNKAEMFIRGKMDETFDSTPTLQRTGRPLYLYPHEDAHELNGHFKEKFPGPYHLIIPDGNWQKARKVRHREKDFQSLLAVKLPSEMVTQYKLRKSQYPQWLSTFEATAHALGILESPILRDELMEFFLLWVKRTEQARSGDFSHIQ